MKYSKKITALFAAIMLLSVFALTACNNSTEDQTGGGGTVFNPTVTMKEISKEEYLNKTLAGLLGQFSGFLSGYEFVWYGQDPYIGMPESWFDFLNGPYAGNYEHYTPVDTWRYDRLRVNPDTGKNEVYSDDDFHIDIFNQLIIDEFGISGYAVKEAWKKYKVSDWGGGQGAIDLISAHDMLPPFTGTIESGNRWGWCTEAYIENETLGMNAPGMPNVATELVDTFASNVGYFDSLVWAKFYAAMYSLAYFEDDILVVMEKAKEALPEGSYPRQMYDYAVKAYNDYPNDYRSAGLEIVNKRRGLYRIDNVQTDPNINGAFALLSWLYGKNSYLDSCKYASILGFDGDCTAAIVTGVMGIIKGFKQGNEEYDAINSTIYYDGEGVYFNDDGSTYSEEDRKKGLFQARICSEEYPTRQKIDDIIDLYRKNFEKILVKNGGKAEGDKYLIPTASLIKDHSFLFKNHDAEERTQEGFTAKNGKLEVITEGENINTHSGFAGFKMTNLKDGEVYHKFTGLKKGKYYRLSTYVKTTGGTQVSIFARSKESTAEMTFANVTSLINKAFVFEAMDDNMEVGFSFHPSSAKSEVLYFDDFMLEEVDYKELSQVSDSALRAYQDKYTRTVKKPDGLSDGEEVVIRVEYRNSTGSTLNANVIRNGVRFGGVLLSNTSKNATTGKAYLDIPYVFDKDSDTIMIDFTGSKAAIGCIKVLRKTQYMFR